jgi:hypothetical protein
LTTSCVFRAVTAVAPAAVLTCFGVVCKKLAAAAQVC